MVIDTSAIVAILWREADAERFAQAIGDAATCLISAVSRVELSFVIEGRYGEPGRRDLERFLASARIETPEVNQQQVQTAIEAFRRYGKGRHRARLNIGDCFAYALSKTTGLPLPFKGGDFAHTDISPALPVIPRT